MMTMMMMIMMMITGEADGHGQIRCDIVIRSLAYITQCACVSKSESESEIKTIDTLSAVRVLSSLPRCFIKLQGQTCKVGMFFISDT